MRKLFALIILSVGLMASCNSDLAERVEVLEKTTVAFLQSSIFDLYSECSELREEIAALEMTADQADVTALKKSLAALEAEIRKLSSLLDTMMDGYYTSEEIDALLKQMNEDISRLQASVGELEMRIADLLKEKLGKKMPAQLGPIVLILTGHLAGTAAHTAGHIKIETKCHDRCLLPYSSMMVGATLQSSSSSGPSYLTMLQLMLLYGVTPEPEISLPSR